MKMIRNAVMRTAKGKLRSDERKIFGRPALVPQAHPKFVAQIETFGSANGGHAAEAWERRRLAGVFVAELAGGTPALPRKGAMRSMLDGPAQNVGEDPGWRLVRVNFTRLWV
jgi:hypothetical protein